MPISFITYRNFERRVRTLVSAEQFVRLRYILPSVDYLLRMRFIDTLSSGCDISSALDIINTGKKLPDNNYSRYLLYLKVNKRQLHLS